jgi:hypothetical protein
MSDDALDELLGIKPSYDVPPAKRRSMAQVGILSEDEGGLIAASLKNQPADLVNAALSRNSGQLISRWGHIVLRKALVSRLGAPQDMKAADFVAERAKLLNRMGEYQATRALVQDVDTGNWNDAITDAALTAYVATADIVGACPAVQIKRGSRDDANWMMLQAICRAYAGEATSAVRQLDRALRDEKAPEIDLVLAQRFAGAAGDGRQAVEVEWEGVDKLTPWRFALASAVGEQVPQELRSNPGPYYQRVWATLPMIPLSLRASGATRAAREGILSSEATVDLFSEIYASNSVGEEAENMAQQLREAYVAVEPAERVAAMRELWSVGEDEETQRNDYGRYVMTAYAAARLPADETLAGDAAPLIASMLSAGLDRDAALWANVVEPGSEAWALLALGTSATSLPVPPDAIEAYYSGDGSEEARKSKLLLAGLAGLGRVAQADLAPLSEEFVLDLSRQTKWTRAIAQAAQYRNAGLVALLAGLGMQGDSWDDMTPLHLFHIVSALNQVGLSGEARMIAAEAMARS